VRIGEDSAPGTIICSSTVLAMKHELRIPFSIADSPVQLAPALSLANDTNGVPFVLFVCPESGGKGSFWYCFVGRPDFIFLGKLCLFHWKIER